MSPVTRPILPNNTAVGDPTWMGTTPGLSAVAAFDKQLEETECFQWVSPDQKVVFPPERKLKWNLQLFHGNVRRRLFGTRMRAIALQP